jgi:hypothetical protein
MELNCSGAEWEDAVHRAGQVVSEAEQELLRPTIEGLDTVARSLGQTLAALRALEVSAQTGTDALDSATRLWVVEQAGAIRLRLARVGRLLENAVRIYAGRAEEIAVRHGYSAEGVSLPLSVVRSAGRRCNIEA